MPGANYEQLPDDLPVPQDDGAAAHLPGTEMPPLALTAVVKLLAADALPSTWATASIAKSGRARKRSGRRVT